MESIINIDIIIIIITKNLPWSKIRKNISKIIEIYPVKMNEKILMMMFVVIFD